LIPVYDKISGAVVKMFNSLYLPYPRNDLLILIPLLISI